MTTQTASLEAVTAEQKEERLTQILRELRSVVVGFSGGVDSAYLAYMANRVLGQNALCVTAISPSYPEFQKKETARFVEQFGLNHLEIESEELDNPAYRENAPNRCYFCKSELFTKLDTLAVARNYNAVVDGTNHDDLGDYRPGRSAAKEHQVRSPLLEAQMTKLNIRELSRKSGLPTWDKPALPCLSSRFPYGTAIDLEKLKKVGACEVFLKGLGFREFRVRYHGDLARIEVNQNEIDRLFDKTIRDAIVTRFKEVGFTFVSLDLQGFRSGSLNEGLKAPAH